MKIYDHSFQFLRLRARYHHSLPCYAVFGCCFIVNAPLCCVLSSIPSIIIRHNERGDLFHAFILLLFFIFPIEVALMMNSSTLPTTAPADIGRLGTLSVIFCEWFSYSSALLPRLAEAHGSPRNNIEHWRSHKKGKHESSASPECSLKSHCI